MATVYDLNKIKFATDEMTFQRAVDLYESGKVTQVEEKFGAFTAMVIGTKPYRVSISAHRYNDRSCTCYLGQKDVLCKHMVALALYAVTGGQPLKSEEKVQRREVKCSGRREALNEERLTAVKKSIAESMKYIKPYTGPSRTWFANQDSLREGCSRLSVIVVDLLVDKETTALLVKLLLRLDKKLQTGGVDDSNGIVGVQTCFGWEESLVRIFDERDA